MRRSRLLSLVLLVLLSFAGAPSAAHAAISFSGDVSPTDSSGWTSSATCFVGYTSEGTVTVDNGSNLLSGAAFVGYEHTDNGASGLVTITGSGSTWTNSKGLCIGFDGYGVMNISNGGAVNNTLASIGETSNGAGAVTVDGTGSKWINNGSLDVGYQGNGTLKITNGGAVSNNVASIGNYSNSTGTVMVDGTGSTWINNGTLNVGYSGNGTLNITNGGSVSVTSTLNVGYYGNGTLKIINGSTVDGGNGHGSIGYANGYDSQGNLISGPITPSTVTVDGVGSTWTDVDTIRLGEGGSGILNITNGGAVSSRVGSIGYAMNANWWKSAVAIDGAGSIWTTFYMNVGVNGIGTLSIKNGGAVNSSVGIIGYYPGSTGTATVNGAGSTWTNGSLTVGYYGAGTLAIIGGGSATATSGGSINSASLLAIDVGRGSSLKIGSSSGTITNNGTVRILAGAGVAAGGLYSPISAKTWAGAGACQALGGTWDAGSHKFTVSTVASTAAGTPVSINLAQKQRILVSDSSTGWKLGGSFLATTNSSTLTCTATTVSGSTLSSLSSSLTGGETVLSGWNISATSGYTSGSPVYLSFDVGHAQLLDDLTVWNYSGDEWSAYSTFDLTYDRTYASLSVTSLGIYAVSGDLVLNGDANRDGSTDGADLGIVLANYNKSGATWALGDFNGDGSVDGNDLGVILANYNKSLTGVQVGNLSYSAVPEPSAVVLLAAGLIGLLAWRLRRGR